MKREHFDQLVASGLLKPELATEIVRDMVNDLITMLYSPDEEHEFTLDRLKALCLGIDVDEPVNWGDLGCSEVRRSVIDGKEVFLVTLEEAMAEQCPTLCRYVQRYIKAWGWDVEVQTTWRGL